MSQHLTPMQRRILEVLAARPLVSHTGMIDALYGDDPDGGPEDPVRVISVHILNLRRQVERYGVTIETKRAVGWRIAPEHRERALALLADDDGAGWVAVAGSGGMAAAEAVAA